MLMQQYKLLVSIIIIRNDIGMYISYICYITILVKLLQASFNSVCEVREHDIR